MSASLECTPGTDSPAVSPEFNEKILAFQTFTTMLAQLKTHSKSSSAWKVDDNIVKGPKHEELQVLDVLATLLVRNHEVVAVSADRTRRNRTIQVIACAHLCNEVTLTSDTQLDDKDGIYYATSNPQNIEREKQDAVNAGRIFVEDALTYSGKFPAILQPSQQVQDMVERSL